MRSGLKQIWGYLRRRAFFPALSGFPRCGLGPQRNKAEKGQKRFSTALLLNEVSEKRREIWNEVPPKHAPKFAPEFLVLSWQVERTVFPLNFTRVFHQQLPMSNQFSPKSLTTHFCRHGHPKRRPWRQPTSPLDIVLWISCAQIGDFLRGGNGRGGRDSTPRWEVQRLSAAVPRHPDRHASATSPSLWRDDQNLRDHRVTVQWRRAGCRASPYRHPGCHANVVPPG